MHSIIKSINSFLDEIRMLRREFCGIKACNDTNEGKISFNIVTPFVLAEAPSENMIKLCL